MVKGSAQYTQVATLLTGWNFIGVGGYLGSRSAGVTIENATTGAIDLGTIAIGHATRTQVSALGSEWVSHS